MRAYDRQWQRWRAQVAGLARSGVYAVPRRAELFFLAHVLPAWRSVGGEPVAPLSTTQLLVVHLFGRGVLGVDAACAPRLVLFPPSHEVGRNGLPVARRAIPIADIARLVGRSRSAVEEALARFRGKGHDGARLKAVCRVISLPTGVVLDVRL